ncbi:MAG TPA: restriction endonuclease subunit S [Methanosarcinaceae archaeon]|nr:restriction endonuclease subunit S [Methanosarcinaceae archaeon]
MKSKWQHLSLREAGISLIDCVHKTPEAKDEGFPYVAIPQMKDGRINFSSTRKISHEDFLAWTVKAKPEAHDIVISRRCNPGESAYVPEGVEFALGQNLVLLRSDGKKVYRPYLRWLLNSPFWWAEVRKFMNVGAIFTSLKCADVPNFKLPIPPLDEQIKISEILHSLDQKIELNYQINQTFESMAQAIFKSWFVDFDPVKAKITALKSGEDAEGVTRAAMRAITGKTDDELDQMQSGQPEEYAQLKTTAELFPATMQDSELGEVPEGWEVGNFKDCCGRVESGGTPKRSEKSYWGGKIKWLASGEVRDVIVLDTKEKITEEGLKNSSAKLWPKGTTVVAMYGATAGQVCMISSEMSANQACCALIPKPEFISYIFFSARNAVSSLSDRASGSAQQNLNKSLVANHECLIPEIGVMKQFEKSISPFLDKWRYNEIESANLSQVRDTLLPKLLSGELSVDAVELAEAEA